MLLRSVLLLLLLLTLPSAASAMTEWRTQVQVTVGSGNNTVFAFDGGLNDPSSSQTLTSGSSALSMASASLSPTGLIPTLRVLADNDGTRAQAVAWGVQSFTNTGSSALTTDLVMHLTADIAGINDVEARVYLFQDANFQFSRDPGTILFESSSMLWPGFEDFANNLGPTGFDISINNTPGPVDETRMFNFTVDPGESFYVWARLVGTASNPGEVDAFNTLTASFTNTTGLTPAAVPEPAMALLVGCALLAFSIGRAGYFRSTSSVVRKK